MVAAVLVRSERYVPERWLVEINRKGETFGELMQRERKARGWYQKDVCHALGYPAQRQSWLSRHENDLVGRPSPVLVEDIARIYALPIEDVTLAAHRSAQRRPDLPGDSVAVPDLPGMRDVLSALDLYEDEELPSVAHQLRLLKSTEVERLQDVKSTIGAKGSDTA